MNEFSEFANGVTTVVLIVLAVAPTLGLIAYGLWSRKPDPQTINDSRRIAS